MTDPQVIAQLADIAKQIHDIGKLLGMCAILFFIFAVFGAFK